jgi:hypothetical protein
MVDVAAASRTGPSGDGKHVRGLPITLNAVVQFN